MTSDPQSSDNGRGQGASCNLTVYNGKVSSMVTPPSTPHNSYRCGPSLKQRLKGMDVDEIHATLEQAVRDLENRLATHRSPRSRGRASDRR